MEHYKLNSNRINLNDTSLINDIFPLIVGVLAEPIFLIRILRKEIPSFKL